MAVTKNNPINTTLRKALDYICNPDKTEEKLLVYSYGCSPDTADIEFEWTLKKSRERTGDKHLARHLIQSFEPGETTSEQAHEIGKRLAEEVLGGKYEFVLTTHIDKGHIHNHIIFCDVDFVNYKRSHVNKKWYYNTRKVSDKLCKEFGLSVIVPGKDKGKTYKERAVANKGTSFKAQLKAMIDTLIPLAKNFDDFLLLMEQNGYTVKLQNKNVSFCIDGRQRFMRSKTLGDDYTIESIKERIAGRPKKIMRPKIDRRINLIIDIQNCIKAQKSPGYEHWAKIQNLKQASKTLNFLTEHNITAYDELENKVKAIHNDFNGVSAKIKVVEKKINTAAVLIKNINIYSNLKPIYQKYKSAKDKEDFAEKHRSEIILFEAAYRELKGAKYPPIADLKKSYSELTEEKTKLYEEYKNLKKQAAEIDVIKSNVDMLLGASHKPEPEISAQLE